jgi:hypothetical protein
MTPGPPGARASRPSAFHQPGGAYSRGEVADAMRQDAVVAAHYEHVDDESPHEDSHRRPRRLRVARRQPVFDEESRWLSPGETVLTDGNTEIRARCGKLLSDNAQQPVAAQEPTAARWMKKPGRARLPARGDDGQLTHVPFLEDWSESSSVAFEKNDPVSARPASDAAADRRRQ